MALSRTSYTKVTSVGGQTSITTGSFTPPNNSLVGIAVLSLDNGSATNNANSWTITDTAGLVWTKRVIEHNAVGFNCEMAIWTAPVTTGVSMTITPTVGANSNAIVAFPFSYTGQNTSAPTGATGTSSSGPASGSWSMALTAASAATSEVIAFAGGTVAGFGNVFQTIGSGWTSVNTDNSAGNYGVTFEAFAGAKSNAEWANTLDPSSTDTYNGSYTVGVALEIVAASGAVTDTGSSRPFARPGLDVGTPRSQLRSPLRLDTGTTPPPFIDQTAGAPSRRLRLGTPGSRLKSPVLDTGTTAPPFIDQTAGMPPRKLRLGTPASRLRSPVLDTGAAASAPNNYLVAAIAGSYAYAGQSASVLLGKLVTAASGSYTYTGQNATLLKSKVVAAVAGSYLISGQAASLLKSNLVTATSGAYTINGQSATITYTPAGHYTVVASAGSYTYTGQSAGILHGSLIAAAAGSYAYSGQSVGIAHNLLVTAASGSYSYAGQSATITYTPVSGAYTVTAIAGSYAISGQDAIITRTGGAQPSGGYGWYSYVRFEQESLRRRKKREEAERLAQEAEQAQQSEIEAELARRLHAELARQAELDDLQRLRMLVARESVPSNVSERVKTAFVKAQAESSFSRLQALAREMERSLEEEEMALLMLLMEES